MDFWLNRKIIEKLKCLLLKEYEMVSTAGKWDWGYIYE